jgi:hypothetical protein
LLLPVEADPVDADPVDADPVMPVADRRIEYG